MLMGGRVWVQAKNSSVGAAQSEVKNLGHATHMPATDATIDCVELTGSSRYVANSSQIEAPARAHIMPAKHHGGGGADSRQQQLLTSRCFDNSLLPASCCCCCKVFCQRKQQLRPWADE